MLGLSASYNPAGGVDVEYQVTEVAGWSPMGLSRTSSEGCQPLSMANVNQDFSNGIVGTTGTIHLDFASSAVYRNMAIWFTDGEQVVRRQPEFCLVPAD